MDHRDYSSYEEYDQFTVSVKQIEEWTGLDFFVNLPLTLQSKAEANTSWTTFSSFRKRFQVTIPGSTNNPGGE